MNKFILENLIEVVGDAYPLFIISINGIFKGAYTFRDIALSDNLLSLEIDKLNITSLYGRVTYIINLGG